MILPIKMDRSIFSCFSMERRRKEESTSNIISVHRGHGVGDSRRRKKGKNKKKNLPKNPHRMTAPLFGAKAAPFSNKNFSSCYYFCFCS